MKKATFAYMLNFALIFAVSTVSCTSKPTDQSVKTGSKVPEFSLLDQDGKSFDLKQSLGKENLVIYFYPMDDTPGCTAESCSFRDQMEVFSKADTRIIGISAQSVESHKNFADKYQLPFTLLSDPGNIVRKLFGVAVGKEGSLPARVTFVVDKSGNIVYQFDSLKKSTEHVDEALGVLAKLK